MECDFDVVTVTIVTTLAWRRCWVVAMGANDMVLSDRVEKYILGKLIDRETCYYCYSRDLGEKQVQVIAGS